MISMHPKKRDLLLLGILCALTLILIREWGVAPHGNVRIDVLDVGQGDSIFITGPGGEQILVDGGPDLSALGGLGSNMSYLDRTLDLLILTHPDSDHVFALPEVLRRYRVQAVMFTGIEHTNAPYRDMLALLREERIPVIIADPAKDIDFGNGLRLDVLWPPPVYLGKSRDDTNNTSVTVKVIYGEDSLLLTGDMEEKQEREMLAANIDLNADILKVAHHGSKTSTSTGFLLAVSPDLAVISAGRNNRYGHPHAVVLRRLEHFGVPIRRTDQEGAIELQFDGKEGI